MYPEIIVIAVLLTVTLYIREKDAYHQLTDKELGRYIPQYPNLTVSAKKKALNRWLEKEAEVVCSVKPEHRLPNAPKGKSKNLQAGAQLFLTLVELFEVPAVGYTLLGNVLAGLHTMALRKEDPSFHAVLSINGGNGSSELKEILSSVVRAIVSRKHWSGKHYEIKRDAILDYDEESSNGISAHIQDFSRIQVKRKEHKVKAPFPYSDTVLLIADASDKQIKEATPYIEYAAVILLDSAAGELLPTKLPASSVSAYDPEVAAQIEAGSSYIAGVLRWWWGKALKNEAAWAAEIVQKARASFGEPDSRYKQVVIDPKQLRDAIRYQVILSFLDALEASELMTQDELAPYRQGAKEAFDPAPPDPVSVRHAEDPDTFLEIMRELVQNSQERIVPDGTRYVKKDKPLAAWRTISGERYLVFLEEIWLNAYAKAVRAKKGIDSSFFKNDHWGRDMQKLLCEHGLIKQASSGYRYRYDLLENGTRDSTYVVAIPEQMVES